jgi:aryl-alcohol dehydrogenase-like predicted oxidoreductase
MEQRDLGTTGLRVSALGYGAGAIGGLMVRGDPAEQTRAVARALEAGVTYFDTAPSYGDGRSEENLGRALRELGAWERVVVGTKVRVDPADLARPGAARAAIRRAAEQSLRRLGRDAVDLLQLHNPVRLGQPDPAAPVVASGSAVSLGYAVGEIAEGLRELVRDGLARHLGFTGLGEAPALLEAAQTGPFETVQTYYNALNPSAGHPGASGGAQDFAGLIDHAARNGLGVIAIRVLAAGALGLQPARHANAGDPGAPLAPGADYDRDLQRARTIARLADELGLEGPLELALRFALANPGLSTALVGYSDFAQLEAALRWAARGPLPEDAVRRVVELARSHV